MIDRLKPIFRAPILVVALVLTSTATAQTDRAAPDRGAPEAATGFDDRGGARTAHDMISAANPHAARAGYDILARGGSALDAIIAAQMVLNVVEPQSSGIGGGAFLLYYAAAENALYTYDGRETAPAAVTETLFVDPDGTTPGYLDAVAGGRSVGVPGLLRMLDRAHHDHGRLPWRDLFAAAISLAKDGFAISPRLHHLAARVPTLRKFPKARDYLLTTAGDAKPIGAELRNRRLAETLDIIARDGVDAFYSGAIAADIVNAVTNAPLNPGAMTIADLAGYQAKVRAPVCAPYRTYRICSMGPPTSGGVTILQILGMLAQFDMARLAPFGVDASHLFAEASRLAFADRDLYLADPDFVAVPVAGLLNRAYLAARAALIDPRRANRTSAAGAPPGLSADFALPPEQREPPSTTHVSVIDRDGNAAALTSSIEFAFGSGLMARGFLLNNQLTDFALVPQRAGVPVANRVAPGKRPRSSMAPTIVFDDSGDPALVIGSPGGANIICYVVKVIVAVIDWGRDVHSAIALPNLCNRNGDTLVEKGTRLEALTHALSRRGHVIDVRDMNSGLHGIAVTADGLAGGADPRREGIALGH